MNIFFRYREVLPPRVCVCVCVYFCVGGLRVCVCLGEIDRERCECVCRGGKERCVFGRGCVGGLGDVCAVRVCVCMVSAGEVCVCVSVSVRPCVCVSMAGVGEVCVCLYPSV